MIPEKKKQSEKLFCPYCGHKKEFKIYTDVNSGMVCKNQLCRAIINITYSIKNRFNVFYTVLCTV